jgi:hypothetical protein
MMPLAFSIGTLLFALATHINIGVRHILPVYIGLSVVCGCIATAAFESTGRSRHLARASVVCLLSWHVASGALQHPDYLAYTNEIAGDHPEGFMVDSDLDWGQDMNRLATYLARVGAERVAFLPFNFTYLRGGHPLPPLTPVDTDHPSPGWNAVSITTWKLYGFPAWAERIPPQERVGRSILLWHIPETSGDFAK